MHNPRSSTGSSVIRTCKDCPYWKDSGKVGSAARYFCGRYHKNTGYALLYKPTWCSYSANASQLLDQERKNMKEYVATFAVRESEQPIGFAWLCVEDPNGGYVWLKAELEEKDAEKTLVQN